MFAISSSMHKEACCEAHKLKTMLKGTNPNNVCNQNVIQKTFIGTPHSNYSGNSVIHEVLNIFIYIYIYIYIIYIIYIIISYYFKFHATSNLQATLLIQLSCYVTIRGMFADACIIIIIF